MALKYEKPLAVSNPIRNPISKGVKDFRSEAITATGHAISGQYQLFKTDNALWWPAKDIKLITTAIGNKLAIRRIHLFFIQMDRLNLSKTVHKITTRIINVKRLLDMQIERPKSNSKMYQI